MYLTRNKIYKICKRHIAAINCYFIKLYSPKYCMFFKIDYIGFLFLNFYSIGCFLFFFLFFLFINIITGVMLLVVCIRIVILFIVLF